MRSIQFSHRWLNALRTFTRPFARVKTNCALAILVQNWEPGRECINPTRGGIAHLLCHMEENRPSIKAEGCPANIPRRLVLEDSVTYTAVNTSLLNQNSNEATNTRHIRNGAISRSRSSSGKREGPKGNYPLYLSLFALMGFHRIPFADSAPLNILAFLLVSFYRITIRKHLKLDKMPKLYKNLVLELGLKH